jgi:hypothetical protein
MEDTRLRGTRFLWGRFPSGRSPSGAVSNPEHTPAAQIIRQRRSAVAFDAKTSLSAATFFTMLERVMPYHALAQLSRPMPWDAWPYDPAIHLMLFVHRIDGLAPGLYFLVRDVGKLGFIQQS